MRVNWDRCKNFLTAEEIPRWIGLSMVGILLFGLVAVAQHSMSSAHERFVAAQRGANESAVQFLAWAIAEDDASDAGTRQRALREFSRWHACEKLRIVGSDGLIAASIQIDEVGGPDSLSAGNGPIRTDVVATYVLDDQRRLVVAPIGGLLAGGATGSGARGQYVQCVYPAAVAVGMFGVDTGSILIVLIVIVVFLVVYRLMRRHFRSMSRISENLMQRGDQLEQDLSLLRLTETEDALGEQWNQLIDLVDELSAGARRATASTELKEVLEKSRQNELVDVVNTIPDGLLCVVDRDHLAFANTMAKRLLGIESLVDPPVPIGGLELSPTGISIIEPITKALRSDGTFVSDTAVIEVDDGDSTFRVRVMPFNARKKRGECVVTITDISQQVRADKAAEEFVAQVTHELRTPLTNIRAYAETLSSGVFDDPKVITDCYNVITKETRRLSRLIEDMLSMSQLEVGTVQLQVAEVNLTTLLNDGVRDVRGLADEKRIDLQVALPSKLPPLRGDRDKLAVVLNNLLGNALKYTPEEGTILVGCQVTDDEVMITVKDTGMGIDPVDHERIFEKFQRGSSEDVEGITGTGIGLTTAREIARCHGGDIEVMSAKDEGSTFILKLPLQGIRAKSLAQVG